MPSGNLMSQLPTLALEFALLLPAIICHEVAHGYMAFRLGDPTARDAGRLTLDPLKHIDPWGTLLLPVMLLVISGGRFAFGYAKPVPIDPRRMTKVGYQTGMLLTGIAGPGANIVLALAGAVIFRALALLGSAVPETVLLVLYFFVFINLLLVFFNLIPIPPFDGSRVFQWFLKGSALDFYNSLERYGFLIIVVLLFVLPSITNVDPLGWYLGATVIPITRFLLGA